MKSSSIRASSVSFPAVAAVLVYLPAAEWNNRRREKGEKTSRE
jgi:hypothetical protein